LGFKYYVMKLKMTVGITLFLFFVSITAIVIAGLISYESGKGSGRNNAGNNKAGNAVTTALAGKSSITLSTTEIAKHGNAADCWMVIGGKVYDVTGVLYSHPGGSSTILNHCGKESTSAWNTKDTFPGRLHSAVAQSLLGNYLLGDVNATITSTDVQNVQKAGAAASGQLRGRGEDD
jgi:cytochrome b involved in lipid metabolism